jgi:hypothetical protein
VKYLGDPNEPGLDAEERRQLLRRIANRESARRMRKRHLEELHHLSTEVGAKPPACTHAPPSCSSGYLRHVGHPVITFVRPS